MNVDYLQNLVEQIAGQKAYSEIVQGLKEELSHSEEPFVWSVIDLGSVNCALPERIKSGWVFVLKRDIPTGCHYHPNSIQHMVMIEGRGQSNVAGLRREMVRYCKQLRPKQIIRRLRLHPLNLRADRAQFLLDFLVPAINVVNAVNPGLAFSRQPRQDQ